jgi:hypothetical protein
MQHSTSTPSSPIRSGVPSTSSYAKYIKSKQYQQQQRIHQIIDNALKDVAQYSHYLSLKISLRPCITTSYVIQNKICIERNVLKDIFSKDSGNYPRTHIGTILDTVEKVKELEYELLIYSNYVTEQYYITVLYEQNHPHTSRNSYPHLNYSKLAFSIQPDIPLHHLTSSPSELPVRKVRQPTGIHSS